MNRKDILDQLNKIYLSKSNDIIILYGSKYVGLQSLIKDFSKNKSSFVYKSRQCEVNTQFDIMTNEILEALKKRDLLKNGFESAFKLLINENNEKKVVIFDDFVSIIKGNKTFLNLIISLVRDTQLKSNTTIIFASDDINYVENEMPEELGNSIYEINRIIKVDKLDSYELLKSNKNISFNDFLTYYSILGGNSDLWKLVDTAYSPKDFICNKLLNSNNYCWNLGNNILPNDLREKSVYNTILYYLSHGIVKLNDIHNECGYDRAKISVYLKNLNKRGLIEKSDSFDIGNNQNEKKGLYNITDNYTNFWFRYIFPNISIINNSTPEKFYKRYIEPTFNQYRESIYKKVVVDYLNLSGKYHPKYRFSLYYDKYDSIDIVGVSDSGEVILIGTRYSQPHMAYSQLEKIIDSSDKMSLKYSCIYLFSAVDFDQKLHMYSSVHENVRLIEFIG